MENSMKVTKRLTRFAWPALALVAALTVVGVVPRLGFTRDGAIWSERPSGSAPVAMTQAPAWVEIAKTVKPAVVNVSVKGERKAEGPAEEFMQRFGKSPKRQVRGLGSGFVINADGYVVTNNHVVDGATEIRVKFSDGRELPGKVVGRDDKTDLALVKVEATGLPVIPVGDSSKLEVGEPVMAIGNPFGLEQTVTTGIVSATGRTIGAGPYDDFIQIDAPVNRGNSGGPTFDVDGGVIGVNTAIYSPSGGSVGIAFAIPAETVQSVIGQLKDKGAVSRGWIGVQIQPVTADIADSLGLKATQGALVAEPQSNSPAVKAGIQAGDVITAVNGTPVRDARDLARQIGAMSPGTTVRLTVLQKGQEKTISVTLGELPNEREARATPESREQSGLALPRLGLTLAPASEVAGSGSEGVVVTQVEPDGVAAEHGFKAGDVILEVAGRKVASPADVRASVGNAQREGKRTVLIRVKSGEGTKFVALRLGRA
jgi:serine protease Do